jgi:hypothetical protein
MHAGYVLDQEGDSWAVAFHDADDAAAFSLQVRTHTAVGGPLGFLKDTAGLRVLSLPAEGTYCVKQ